MDIWVETRTGKLVHLLHPSPDEICMDDIAYSLSMQCRYTGHCDSFYSVAEHSILVQEWLRCDGHCEYIQLLGLLHDAPEAYTGDISKPMKLALGKSVEVIEQRFMEAICASLEIETPTELQHAVVKKADNVLLATEVSRMMPSKGEGWNMPGEPDMELFICGYNPAVARAEYLRRFTNLTNAPKAAVT